MIIPLSSTVPPLTPDGDQARRWAEHELRDPVYAAAQPTILDRAARTVQDFFAQLFGGHADASWGLWLAAAVVLAVIALILVATWRAASARQGRPRRPESVELFGHVENRSADQLRRAAAGAARTGDWTAAIVLRVRALARDSMERGVVDLSPGTTVHGFAAAAGRVFAAHAELLQAAADAFDDVRYLRRPGSAAQYETVARADDAVRDAAAAEAVR